LFLLCFKNNIFWAKNLGGIVPECPRGYGPDGSHAYEILWACPEFSVWLCWLQRHFERPQLFIWIPRWL